MAAIIRRLFTGYNIAFNEWTDTKTKDWFLIGKPYQCILLLGLYLMFVLKWGPRWMQKRKAFDLYWILIVYNVIQIVLCAKVFINSLKFWGWGGTYKWICEPVDHSHSEDAKYVANVAYDYFLLKIIDLLDTVNNSETGYSLQRQRQRFLFAQIWVFTKGVFIHLIRHIYLHEVFFVLRKKSNQVSFLHVYHHTGMVLLIWGAVTYIPGGHGTSVGVVNSFVHVVMYSYYLLSTVKPSVTRALWIKKFVTQLQILQFLLFVLHIGILPFKTDCAYPRWTAALFLPQNFFMLVLFTDFYIRTYIRNPKAKTDARKVNGEDKSNGKLSKTNGHKNGMVKGTYNGRIEHFIINHNESTLTVRSIDCA